MNNENSNKVEEFEEIVDEVEDVTDIKNDILRYTTNKLSYWLCILAIVFNVANFLICYKINSAAAATDKIANFLLGLDLLVNVILIIVFFLLAEKTKAYKKEASYVCIGLAVVEVARIFIIPLSYYLAYVETGSYGLDLIGFIWCIVLLILAAASLVGAALINLKKYNTLQDHLKKIGENK